MTEEEKIEFLIAVKEGDLAKVKELAVKTIEYAAGDENIIEISFMPNNVILGCLFSYVTWNFPAVVDYLVDILVINKFEFHKSIDGRENSDFNFLFTMAFEKGDLSFLKKLFEYSSGDFFYYDTNFLQPWNGLYAAAYHGRLETVKFLIEEQNVDINISNSVDDHGHVFIEALYRKENTDVQKYLSENPDINIDNIIFNDVTILDRLERHGSFSSLKYLFNREGFFYERMLSELLFLFIKKFLSYRTAPIGAKLVLIQQLIEKGAKLNYKYNNIETIYESNNRTLLNFYSQNIPEEEEKARIELLKFIQKELLPLPEDKTDSIAWKASFFRCIVDEIDPKPSETIAKILGNG